MGLKYVNACCTAYFFIKSIPHFHQKKVLYYKRRAPIKDRVDLFNKCVPFPSSAPQGHLKPLGSPFLKTYLSNIGPTTIGNMRDLLFFMLLLARPAYAQVVNMTQLNLEQGLPSNETYQVTQDAQGFVWICTDHGVVRYDGQVLESFSTANGLVENTIFRMYQDHQQRLWFLGMQGSLCYWDGERMQQPVGQRQIVQALNNPIIPSSLVVDSNDVLYFAKGVGGPGYYSKALADSNVYFHPLEVTANNAQLVLNAPTNLLLTNLNSSRHPTHWTGQTKPHQQPLVAFPRWEGYLRREHEENGLYQVLFGNETVFIYQAQQHQLLYELPIGQSVLSAYLDRQQQLWVATRAGVLFYGTAPFAAAPQRFLADHQVAGIYQDHEGSYWVATLDQGVFFISDWEVLHFFKKPSAKIQQIVAHQGQLIGVGLNQVYQLHRQHPFEEHLSQIPDGTSLFDLKVRQEELLISNGMVAQLDADGRLSFKGRFHNYVRYSGKTIFLEEEDNRIIMGHSNGLWELLEDSSARYCQGHWVQSIEKKDKDAWWLGTTKGLFYYDQQQDTLVNLGVAQPLLSQSILDLAYFQQYLLVGTKGNGVLLLDPNRMQLVRQWTTADGLNSPFIHCFTVENDHTLWVGTNQGANRLTVKATEIQRSLLLNSQNYLPSNGVNAILLQDSSIWMATDKGLAYLPQHLFGPEQTSADLPMVLKSIQINGHPVPIQSSYTLDHDQQNIVLDFFALSFKSSAALSYRYQLQPQHHKTAPWNYTQIPQLNFTQLEPGHYTLRIEGSTMKGQWSSDGLEYTFYIRPHFTQTWWFILSVGSVLVLLLGLYFRNRLAKNNLEKGLAEAEQKALRSQMNPHFLFNAINSVFYFLYKNQKQSALDFLQQFAALMRGTLENSQHALLPLKQDLEHLQLYLSMEEARLSSGSPYVHNFQIVVDETVALTHWNIPPMLIQPLVENAIVHGLAPKEGDRRLTVRIQAVPAGLHIHVEDNGIGRAAAKALQQQFLIQKTSKGLPLLRQRIATINQLLHTNLRLLVEDVHDQPHCRTRCTLELPHALLNQTANA